VIEASDLNPVDKGDGPGIIDGLLDLVEDVLTPDGVSLGQEGVEAQD